MTRGHINLGWRDTYNTFSFASYYNPQRVHFGMLRVLNDNTVAPGMGYCTHPHENMEIISIPLDGDLEHRDSRGNVSVIKKGDIQVLSAGKGICHSEYNRNANKQVRFLQIWIFPEEHDTEPHYDQVKLDRKKMRNDLLEIVAPCPVKGDGVCIRQQAWLKMGCLDKGVSIEYKLKKNEDGVYIFVIKGDVEAGGTKLGLCDGLGIWDADKVTVKANSDSEVLLIEVPMN